METMKKLRKSRVHKILFDKELPFAPKSVRSKKAYTRKDKYKNVYYGDKIYV